MIFLSEFQGSPLEGSNSGNTARMFTNNRKEVLANRHCLLSCRSCATRSISRPMEPLLRLLCSRPVSGLAGPDASPSHEIHRGIAHSGLTLFGVIDASTPAYRCGGSTGLKKSNFTCFPFNRRTFSSPAPRNSADCSRCKAVIIPDREKEF